SGLDKTKSLFKAAQEPAKPIPGNPAEMGPGPGPAPTDVSVEEKIEEKPEDKSDMVAKLRDALDDANRYASELEKVLGGLEGEEEALDAVPMAGEADFDPEKPATLASLNKMRKTINGLLQNDARELLAYIKSY